MARQTLAYYKSAINEEVNFTGFMSGTKEEDAINDAFVCQEKGMVPVLFEISIDCDYNLVKINRPEYTPYWELEADNIMIQDGICLIVQNVENVKVDHKGVQKTLAKVSL